jgi:hypothetical protein
VAHLLVQSDEVVALLDVILYGLQLHLAQLVVDVACVLLQQPAVVQDAPDDIMRLELLQLLVQVVNGGCAVAGVDELVLLNVLLINHTQVVTVEQVGHEGLPQGLGILVRVDNRHLD